MTMTDRRTPTAVISGGSLAGLMTGIVLLALGFKVTILERADKLEDAGAGIVLGGDTIEFLRTFDTNKTNLALRSESRVYLDRDDQRIGEEGKQQLMTSWTALYQVLREGFDAPRDGSTKARAVYQLASRVDSVDTSGDGVNVNYTNLATHASHTLTADLLIVAEGASSSLRSHFAPQCERKYAGYLGFRGLAKDSDLPPESEHLKGHFSFFHSGTNDGQGNTQFLCYLIPGPNITLEPGERLMNWVWYQNYRDRGVAKADGRNTNEEEDLGEMLTDKNGKEHPWSIPMGFISDKARKQMQDRVPTLPPSMQAIVNATKDPFIQAITDVFPPMSQLVHAGGKVLFVGDTVIGPRPHTAASTNQGSMHALSLLHTLQNSPELESLSRTTSNRDETYASIERLLQPRWEKNGVNYARMLFASGKEMGNRSQFGTHPQSVDKPASPASSPQSRAQLDDEDWGASGIVL